MPQQLYAPAGANLAQLTLPDPNEELLDGVTWGRADILFTPAYWAAQAWLDHGQPGPANQRFGQSLREEAAACVLGGHGIPAHVGVAAFCRLRDLGLFDQPAPSADVLLGALSTPL